MMIVWLITTTVAALIVSAIYVVSANPKKYNLHWLAIMLWGASLMMLVDHLWGYDWTSPLLEVTTSGLISDGVLLGIVMLIPVFGIWELSVLVGKISK